jgi:predicted PhzF superfamily epimerase YddE/YHI9
MPTRRFAQVDVLSTEPFRGNPVAVVLDADGVSDADMHAFARWTNLSETTFLLPPRDPEADYRVRIMTPDGELPFAGHPTLGSAHAWREAGGVPRTDGRIVQACGVGLVELRRTGDRWAFAGPPLTRYEPLDPDLLARVTAGLGLEAGDVLAHSWLVNGPRWIGVRLASAEQVLAVRPDFTVLDGLDVGVVGPWGDGAAGTAGSTADGTADSTAGNTAGNTTGSTADEDGHDADDTRPDVEVRGFVNGGYEDPVTGSLNAGIARWLRDTGQVPARYVAAQGTCLQRAGRVHVDVGDDVWVSGDTTTLVEGSVVI